MNQKSAGWLLFIGAMAMMASLMAGDIQNLKTWSDATAPGFVGLMLAHLGAVMAAFVGGKIIPEDRDVTDRTRSTDPQQH